MPRRRIQAKQACLHPALIRVETRSGHGSSNLSKAIDAQTDMWSFMFFNIGLEPSYQ